MTTRVLLLAVLLTAGCNQAADRERAAAEAARAAAEAARAEAEAAKDELAKLKAARGGVAPAEANVIPAAADAPALPGEETLAPDKAPVGTPLRPRPADPVFRIGNPRFVQENFGPFQNLVIDYDRQRDGQGQTLTLLFRTPDGQSAEARIHSALNENSGTLAIRGGFGPWNQIPRNAELYLINTDGRYEQKYTFKVSNSVSLGKVEGRTLARDWTAGETTALRKPPPPPKKYLIPSFDPNLGDETKLIGEPTAPARSGSPTRTSTCSGSTTGWAGGTTARSSTRPARRS